MADTYKIIFLEKDYFMDKDEIMKHARVCRNNECGCRYQPPIEKGFTCVCNQFAKEMGW